MEFVMKKMMAGGGVAAMLAALACPMAAQDRMPPVSPDQVQPPVMEEEQQEQTNLITVLQDSGQYETLLAALEAADLTDTFTNAGPFTLFAPTDEAFGKLPEGAVDELLDPENRDSLIAVLTYHVVPVRVTAEYAVSAGELRTLGGRILTVTKDDDKVKVNDGAIVTEADIDASNGLIHSVDAVLMP